MNNISEPSTTYLPSDYLDSIQVAKIFNLSPMTLNCWRSQGKPFIKYVRFNRSVRYLYQDVLDYIAEQTALTTQQ